METAVPVEPDDRIIVRPAAIADAEGIAGVHVQAWRETYGGLMPDAVIASRPFERRVEQWSGVLRDPGSYFETALFVAENGQDILGFGACGEQRNGGLVSQGYRGEFSALYVLKSGQRRGAGRGLMRAMAPDLSKRGYNAASAWVLRDNAAAREFYEWLGGEIVGHKEEDWRGTLMADVAYGWQDLMPLMTAMSAADAIALYELFETNGIKVWIDGGWGVDALLGRQKRSHTDLDIVIEVSDVARLRELLARHGYADIPRDDTRPWNFVLGNEAGRQVDVHAVVFDDAGNGIYGPAENGDRFPADALKASGIIDGRTVRCLSPEFQVRSHSGYELKAKDVHDVQALCARFGIDCPLDQGGVSSQR